MALDLSTLTTEQQLAAIYIGYYDRAADPVGADFWEGAVANPNLSLADIATDFATQPETLIAYPFLDAPTAEEAEGFIAEVYLNLFNRAPDAAGLEFWSTALLNAIAGDEGALSVGEIILAIISGAQNSEDGQDLTTILNKIEVSTTWTSAAEAAAIDYTTDSAAQASAKSIIEGVTEEASTVVSAKSTIDSFFVPAPVPGDSYFLTSGTDRGEDFIGTSDDDEFLAYIEQNPFAGGVSNSLSSADHLDGGAGNDRLYAELTNEFVGVNGGYYGGTDVQPRSANIEEIDIEARDSGTSFFGGQTIIVDAKNITDIEEIGSYYSDGDLYIENLTTLTSSGLARNTSEITVTMDHTDNFNTDGDASDLEVLFDNDYLLSGQEAAGQIFYFLLDEDAELAGNPNRLNNIDVDGIRFTIEGVDVTLEAPEANVAGTHQGFVNALQAPLQALIADGTLPAGTTLTLDPTIIDTTFLDNGAESDDIPAIVLTSGDGSEVIATGFSRIEEEIGEYDVYGRFNSVNEVEDQPISIDIDLHKTGRGGEGGNLIVGAKDTETPDGIAAGIEVFNINVLGAGNDDPNGGMTKPSDLGTITSTGNELREVYIATDPVFAAGDTYASLTVRNGFDQAVGSTSVGNSTFSNVESGDLELINADAFLGDLTLGEISTSSNPVTGAGRITNADTITAQGGGDVSLALNYSGTERDQAYSVTTAGGDDDIDIVLSGDALDYANSSLNVATGSGDDDIEVNFAINLDSASSSEQLNQAILDNVEIDGGAGDDDIDVDGLGNANIMGGTGEDVIKTDGDSSSNAIWAFNFDAVRAAPSVSTTGPDELPGEQLSLAYIGGATVTVTLSGAGVSGNAAAGGGVMSDDTDDFVGAIANEDGYENSVEINELLNGNDYYGDQRDINAAIMEAINDDAVLSELLSVSMGANNTLVITSKTSGAFDATDLRIDIAQVDQDTAADWDDVEDEAQAIFQDSSIVVDSLTGTSGANGNTNANYGAAALNTSALADAWYDGLSAAGTEPNSTATGVGEGISNLHTLGTASVSESDNVINGGNDNDLIVLSTDADGAGVLPFTVSSNNALINAASNETVEMTGLFGDDTVMNFQDGDFTPGTLGTVFAVPAETTIDFTGLSVDLGVADGSVVVTNNGVDTTIVLDATAEIVVDGTLDDVEIAAAVAAALGGAPGTPLSQVVLTGVDDAAVSVVFDDGDGTNDPDGQPVVAGTPATEFNSVGTAPVNAGLDFLDFTAYLTSTEDVSGSSSVGDSEQLTDVTISADTDATANEVIVTSYDEDDDTTDGDTFESLSASDIEALYNDDTDIDNLVGTAFEQDESTTVVDGNGKAILMVENANNLGEYKVFELSWDASTGSSSDDTDLDATLLGSLDFGDSLDDLANINLVGSEEYATLLSTGFYA